MFKNEQSQQFIIDKRFSQIRRRLIRSDRTIMCVFLSPNEGQAKEQLSFFWKGLTECIMVVGAKNHPLDNLKIKRLITDGGGAFQPRKYFQDYVGYSCTKEQTRWFVSLIDPNTKIDNVIVNSAGRIPFGFAALLLKLLPKRTDGREINFYHIDEIEKYRR